MGWTRRVFGAASLLTLAACASGGATGDPEVAAAQRAEIDSKATAALNRLYAEDPSAKEFGQDAKGILIFPEVIKGGVIGFTGEGGAGVLRVDGQTVDYYNMTGGGIGLALGIQTYSQVLMFTTDEALANFRDSAGWEAGVDGSVALLDAGATGAANTSNVRNPIVGFVFGEQGLMASATFDGTKYTKLDP